MDQQEQPAPASYRDQLRQAASGKAGQFVDELIAKHGVATIMLLRTSFDLGPPVRTTESEAIARVEAARELELAAHQIQRDYIRQARETGSTWYTIGRALDLFWQSIVSNESIADEAFDYARTFDGYYNRKDPYTWTCSTCHQAITDHGPWPQLPKQEEGHATDCEPWNHDLEVWRRHNGDLP